VDLIDQTTAGAGEVITGWVWTVDGISQGGNSNTFNHCFGQGGRYDIGLTVTTATGCSAQLVRTDYVAVDPQIVAEFTFNPDVINGYDSVVKFQSETPGATQWFWTFGDGAVSFEENPAHIYRGLLREYCVRLWASTNTGCADEVQHCIPADPTLEIFFPNSFTPNRDGKNDVYEFYGSRRNIDSFRFLVFDRWGELVFETREFDESWNGKLKNIGDELPPGVYVYRADITTINRRDHIFMGHISLLR
jgi:gliding motility-associated-like protein